VTALLAPPGQPLAARLLHAREIAHRCGPDDWPPIRAAVLDPATPDEVANGCLEAIYHMYLAGTVDAAELRPVTESARHRTYRYCAFSAVQLLGAVPTGWAVAGLRGYVGPAQLGANALRALAEQRHLRGLRTLRGYTDDQDPEVRATARRLFDEQVARVLRAGLTPERPAPADQAADGRVFAVLVALRGWTDILILLRAGHGDAATRAALAELSVEDLSGPGRENLLRKIKAAAGRRS
jgi:hypothetical protein